MNFCEKKFDLDKMQFFLEVSNLPPFWSTICTSLPFVLNELSKIKEHVTSGLTHLACFTSINLSSSSYKMLERSILHGLRSLIYRLR